jgi:hypothetical protein
MKHGAMLGHPVHIVVELVLEDIPHLEALVDRFVSGDHILSHTHHSWIVGKRWSSLFHPGIPSTVSFHDCVGMMDAISIYDVSAVAATGEQSESRSMSNM